jgi:hypothetical protein
VKRIVVGCLLVAGIAACDRVCGDMQALLVTAGAGGEAGLPSDSVAGAGEGGVSSPSDGGAPSGGTGDGGSGGTESTSTSGTSGSACAQPPSAQIIDFDDGSLMSVLGEMRSDDGGQPQGTVDTMAQAYREIRYLASSGTEVGFTFQFNACVDASLYTGIEFLLQGSAPAGIDVSIITTANQSAAVHFDPDDGPPKCIAFKDVDAKKEVLHLRFVYVRPQSPMSPYVNVVVDNLAFTQGECSGI